MDTEVLVEVMKEVQVEILDWLVEILDLAMWASKLMDQLVYALYKVPADAY